MMTRTLLARCAPFAIAASTVLPAIPAFAQDAAIAEPVVVLPSDPVMVTPAPAPAIVLPDPVAAPVVSAVEAVPVELATTRAPVVVPAARKTSSPVAERTAEQSVGAVAPQVVTRTPPSTAVTPVTAPVTERPTVRPAPAAPAVATRPNSIDEIALAGILGALGFAAVGGVAFVASRRRRQRVLDEATYEPVAHEPQTPEPVAIAIPEAVYTAPVISSVAAPVASARVSGDPVALPAAMPETFEERDALLKELVAAEPDRANPFVSTRARARRAKLIMQSLGRSFQHRKPRIDLSQYSHRWPALRGWQPATA